MTRDDIVKWSQEAAIMPPDWGATENQWRSLEAFAKLVAEYEREECAKVCEARAGMYEMDKHYWDTAAEECAFAIRARGQD